MHLLDCTSTKTSIIAIINSEHDGHKQVTIISGGGAGHEPSFAALVGNGLLSAAVSGNVFASPSVQQIVNTVTKVGGSAGTLLVIMNYTGDVLHFHLAAEKARVAGYDTAVLLVGDDVSVGRKRSGRVGRRGLAGTILVEKVLAARAQKGNVTLQGLQKLGEDIVSRLATVGAALGHVHLPGRPKADFVESEDQVELGMGIHNETGCRILKPQPPVADLIDQMLDQLLDVNDADRHYVDFEMKNTVLLVNNLGGVSNLEFSAITKIVIDRLGTRNIVPVRTYAGAFMTSLDNKGFSITLLNANDEIIQYLDLPAYTPGWTTTGSQASRTKVQASQEVESSNQEHVEYASASPLQVDITSLSAVLLDTCHIIVDVGEEIDRYDAVVGDGDCGSTLGRTARAIIKNIEGNESFTRNTDAVLFIDTIAQIVEDNMDGTSGALYAIFLNALAASLRTIGLTENKKSMVKQSQWVEASVEALEALQRATPARAGDRTLMDALEPFITTLKATGTFSTALAAARKGKDKTKGMPAAFGRAVYVPEQSWSEVPDPGATGLVYLLEGLFSNQ
ncbi:Dihydroxyacetone kinase 1 [Talaromyces pinophilus]|nr:Dihydroxyacetone kinase 1 [Talaromyces pinophilus]